MEKEGSRDRRPLRSSLSATPPLGLYTHKELSVSHSLSGMEAVEEGREEQPRPSSKRPSLPEHQYPPSSLSSLSSSPPGSFPSSSPLHIQDEAPPSLVPLSQTYRKRAGSALGSTEDVSGKEKSTFLSNFPGFSTVADSLRRSRTLNMSRSSLQKSAPPPKPALYAGFDLSRNNIHEEDDEPRPLEELTKNVWPSELNSGPKGETNAKSFSLLGGSQASHFEGSSFSAKKDDWRKYFSKETEDSYYRYFSPLNRTSWARLYIHCFAVVTLFTVYYAIIFRFLDINFLRGIVLFESVCLSSRPYFPEGGLQALIYACGAFFCLFSFAVSNTKMYQDYRFSLRFHSFFVVALGICVPLAIYFRSTIEPLGLVFLFALMLYGSVCQPFVTLASIGLGVTVLSLFAYALLVIQELLCQDRRIQECSFYDCWFPLFSFGLLSVMGHFTCIYYSYQVETFTKKMFVKNSMILQNHDKLKKAKEASDQIALSILPKQVWEDLRLEKHQMFHGGFHQSLMYHHENVTILFADIVGFTSLSSRISAESLVWLLNSIFLDFDNLVEKQNLEKIKTLGDCYVLCAGVPKAMADPALKTVKVGLEMVKRTMSIDTGGFNTSLQIRVGIHSGSVMAGLIGHDKLIYDVWGQDVNVASMMEKTGQPSRVHVSEATFSQIIDHVIDYEDGSEVSMENPNLVTKTYFISSLTETMQTREPSQSIFGNTISKTSFQGLKSAKSALNLNTALKRGSVNELTISPVTEKRASVFRVFNKDEEDSHRGRSFDGIALSDYLNSEPNSPTMVSRVSNETYKSERPPVRFMPRKISTQKNEELEGDHLRVYAKTSAQINKNTLTFRDVELELEYQLVYVSKMGGKFFSALVLVLFSTAAQAAMIIYVAPLSLVYTLQALNLALLLPILLVFSFKFWHALPVPYRFASILHHMHSKLTYQMYQFVALFSVFIMFMTSYLAIFALFSVRNHHPHIESALLAVIRKNTLTSVLTSAAFTQLKSFYMLTLVIFLSLCLELLHFAFSREIWDEIYGEPFLHLFLVLYGMVQVQRRLDSFVRRNYLMKRVLVQNSFEIEDLEAKANRFLQNLLPPSLVVQLKQSPEKIFSKLVPKAGVMFCCIANFETFDLPSMRILNEIVSKFDHMSLNYGVEKIKLIGNTYMAATGLFEEEEAAAAAAAAATQEGKPFPSRGEGNKSLVNLALFALSLQGKITEINRLFNKNYVLRIGLETGPVVAGVIGKKKFAFDIWGLAVNVASRMETTGVPDKIQVTREVMNELKDKFAFEERGEVEVKGRGKMETYFLAASPVSNNAKKHLSQSSETLDP